MKEVSSISAPDINEAWGKIKAYWHEVYTFVAEREFNEEEYNEKLDLIRDEEDILIADTSWQDIRKALYFPCDLSSLQSDYLLLRSELLCLLRKIRPLVGTRPGLNSTEVREVCPM